MSSPSLTCRPEAGPGKAVLYLHIPFCKTKCSYCSFNSYAGRDHETSDYLRALSSHMRIMAAHPWTQNHIFSSLYVGGGTPTICDSTLLAELIQKCLASYHFCQAPEITVETNPNTLSAQKLQTLRGAGVNRLSIGVQSFSNRLLQALGRSHTAEEACNAFKLARSAGFSNINLDLMYGLPRQSVTDWRSSLETATDLDPEHFSLYELMVEEGTPIANDIAAGHCHLPNDDTVAEMERLTEQFLSASGYKRYEISNFAKPGRICAHNITYWQNGCWLGLGAGAVGSLCGTRVTNVPDPADYCRRIANNQQPFNEIECLSRAARFRETVIMGLRMMKGVSMGSLQESFQLSPQEYYGELLQRFIKEELLAIDGDYLRLTASTLPLANQVLAHLV